LNFFVENENRSDLWNIPSIIVQSLHFYQKKKPWLPVAILFLIDLMAITVDMEKCPYPIFNQFL
jgi:hypothetical protein